MAVDNHGDAELGARLLHETGERGVIGTIEVLEPEDGFARRKARAVDLKTVADDAGDHPKTRGHARRARSDRTQRRIEHGGVELAGRPVRVDKGAREAGADQRRAQLSDAVEQLIDKRVLGAAEADGIQTRALGKA